MTAFVGGLLILWGILMNFAILFRKMAEYKDDSRIGASGFIEFEPLSKFLFNRIPLRVAKSIIALIGISFVVLGVIVII